MKSSAAGKKKATKKKTVDPVAKMNKKLDNLSDDQIELLIQRLEKKNA